MRIRGNVCTFDPEGAGVIHGFVQPAFGDIYLQKVGPWHRKVDGEDDLLVLTSYQDSVLQHILGHCLILGFELACEIQESRHFDPDLHAAIRSMKYRTIANRKRQIVVEEGGL